MWQKILIISLLLLPSFSWAALDFDGTDDFAAKANTTVNLPTVEPYSVAMWIRPDTTLGADILLEHGERAGTATGWFFGTQASGALFFTTLGIKTYGPTTMTPLVANEWQFVAISMSAAFDVTFYHYRPSTGVLSTETINHTAGMIAPSATADII